MAASIRFPALRTVVASAAAGLFLAAAGEASACEDGAAAACAPAAASVPATALAPPADHVGGGRDAEPCCPEDCGPCSLPCCAGVAGAKIVLAPLLSADLEDRGSFALPPARLLASCLDAQGPEHPPRR